MWLGRLAVYGAHYQVAGPLLAESLGLLQEAGDRYAVIRLRCWLARSALATGDAGMARRILEQAHAEARALGTPHSLTWVLAGLGDVSCWEGGLGEAASWFEACLTLARKHELYGVVGRELVGLGQVAYFRAEYARAAQTFQQFLSHPATSSAFREVADAQRVLGLVNWQQGDVARALALLRESLAVVHRRGERLEVAAGLEGLATVAAGTAQPARAARLLGAAAALRAAIGAPLPPVDRPAYDAALTVTRAALGEDAFAAAWTAGERLTLDESVAEALNVDGLSPEAERSSAQASPVKGVITTRPS
jgi:tetratricopeptide (TPR) repeat protein